MGHRRVIQHFAAILWVAVVSLANSLADEYRHVGDYLLKSHFKLTGDQITPIPIKPVVFLVSTNGVNIRVSTGDAEEGHSTYEIYRSDGISRQSNGTGKIEIIPGLQATSKIDGVLRHLRLSAESMTITTFPGVSNQTIVSYSVAAKPINKEPMTPHSKQP